MSSKKKIGLVSLGCSKNLTDSEYLVTKLQNSGFDVVTDSDQADGVIINTCGFIQDAKQESIDTICEAIRHKQNGGPKKILVTGCLVERYLENLREELPEVDDFIQIKDYPHIGETLRSLFDSDSSLRRLEKNKNLLYSDYEQRTLLTPSHYAYLKIADGCNHKCRFCVIPQIRGRFKSRSPDAILDEAESLVARGIKEIILIAQDLAYYGRDLPGKPNLESLLGQMVKINGLKWIRMLYLYPTTVTDSLIELIAEEEKICSYIDMPLQHASDRMLRTMSRGYTQSHIYRLIDKIRSHIESVTIRTTFIVGYPGETVQDFEELEQMVQRIGFDRMGVFTYSDEESSQSYWLDGKVPRQIANQRRDRLMKTQKNISCSLFKEHIGKVKYVLIDESSNQENIAMGRTEGDAPEVDGQVFVSGINIPQGAMVPVLIEDSLEYDLIGRPVE